MPLATTPPPKPPAIVRTVELERRLDDAMARVPEVPFHLWGILKAIICPELFEGGARPAEPVRARPGESARLAELAGRAARGEALHRHGDRDVCDDEAVVLARPVTVDSQGHKHPRGNCTAAARTAADVPIDMRYVSVAGPARADLAEPSEQQYRDWLKVREKEESRPRPASGPPLTTAARLGQRVRTFRLGKRWSVGQLCAKAGSPGRPLARSTVHSIERGDCSPTSKTLQRLAHAFRVSIDELVGPPDPS